MDRLLDGGFIKGSLIEISGGPGTYKSTLALQFGVAGIKAGENVTYISFEESEESFKQLAYDLGVSDEFSKIDFQYINVDMLNSTWYSVNAASGAEQLARRLLGSIGSPSRLVIDTATTMALYSSRTEIKGASRQTQFVTPSAGDIRIMLLLLAEELRKKEGCTSVLLAESGEGELYLPDEMLKYICDGKIELRKSLLGTRTPRSLLVEKMRHTNHTLGEHPMVLTKEGLDIEDIEQG